MREADVVELVALMLLSHLLTPVFNLEAHVGLTLHFLFAELQLTVEQCEPFVVATSGVPQCCFRQR